METRLFTFARAHCANHSLVLPTATLNVYRYGLTRLAVRFRLVTPHVQRRLIQVVDWLAGVQECGYRLHEVPLLLPYLVLLLRLVGESQIDALESDARACIFPTALRETS